MNIQMTTLTPTLMLMRIMVTKMMMVVLTTRNRKGMKRIRDSTEGGTQAKACTGS
jgi:hypothetical protein